MWWDVVLKLFVIIELFNDRGRPINWFGRLFDADRTFYKPSVSVELGSDSGRSTNQLVQKIKIDLSIYLGIYYVDLDVQFSSYPVKKVNFPIFLEMCVSVCVCNTYKVILFRILLWAVGTCDLP